MRIFGPVVLILARLMVCRQIQIVECRTIRMQIVNRDGRWCQSLLLQRFAHQFQCGLLVSSCLNQNIQDLAFTINGAPQEHFLTPDRYEHFVQMPVATGPWPAAPNLSGIGGSELQNTAPNALVRNSKATFGEKVLDMTEAQCESAIQPDRVLDDICQKFVAFVRNLVHPPRLSRQDPPGQ